MRRLVFLFARPITLWSLHFIAAYALISAACAPRGLIGTDVMRLSVGAITVVAAGIAAVWLVQAWRLMRRTADAAPQRPLVVAAFWSALISLLAILANLWPVATLATCVG